MGNGHVCPASIIIPVFQSRRFLSRAADSVLTQTFPVFELILVDDGSIDGSGEICDRYARQDRRVRVIHQENRGVSSARNRGLSVCRGEYIYFLDGDDYWDPSLLEKTLLAMKQSQADVAVFNAAQVKNGVRTRPFGWYMDSRTIYEESSVREAGLCQLFSEVWRKAYRSSLKEYLVFPETLSCYEDMPVSTSVWCHEEKAVILPGEALYFYERSPHGSLLQHAGDRELRQACHAWDLNIRAGEQGGLDQALLDLYRLRRKEAGARLFYQGRKRNFLTDREKEELAEQLSIDFPDYIIDEEIRFLELYYAWQADQLTEDRLGSLYPLVNRRLFRSSVRLYAADSVRHSLTDGEKRKLAERIHAMAVQHGKLGIDKLSDRLLSVCISRGINWMIQKKGRQLLKR